MKYKSPDISLLQPQSEKYWVERSNHNYKMNNPLGFISARLRQAKPTIADISQHFKTISRNCTITEGENNRPRRVNRLGL